MAHKACSQAALGSARPWPEQGALVYQMKL